MILLMQIETVILMCDLLRSSRILFFLTEKIHSVRVFVPESKNGFIFHHGIVSAKCASLSLVKQHSI